MDRGPVINVLTARQMVTGAARLLHADFAVARTAVGGPGPEEGRPEGTRGGQMNVPVGISSCRAKATDGRRR